ncbi:hypothetical protein DXA56_16950 [Blautia obeum]|nr:hypothetical protein DXA56_16950 [Blautia obeum]
MAFKQKFKNVGVVKNFDDTNKVSSESNSSGYEQDYENVKEVVNLEYDSNAINDINEFYETILRMDNFQLQKFIEEIENRSKTGLDSENKEYKKLFGFLSNKRNKSEALLEYVKTGGATLTFLAALCNLAKALLS